MSVYYIQVHHHQGVFPLHEYFRMEWNWTGYLLLNPIERCTMSYTTRQKVAQNSQLTLGATWPTTTWQDLRGTEYTLTLQCRLSTRLGGQRGVQQQHSTTTHHLVSHGCIYAYFQGMECIMNGDRTFYVHANYITYILYRTLHYPIIYTYIVMHIAI